VNKTKEVDGLIGGRVVSRLEGIVGVSKKQMVVNVAKKKKKPKGAHEKKNNELPKKI
jgi:formiminotetrahydrofolate cyclodeaminase